MKNKKSVLSIRIKELRNELNMTQEDLAKKLGLNNKSSIANYESGYSIPSDEIKLEMCKLFNCSMDYLMGLTSHENPKEELEKRLYNFDLTEDEYNDAINCFMTNDIQALSFVLLFSTEQNSKEYNVLFTILTYVSDYIADIKLPNDKSTLDPLVRDNFQKEIEKAYIPAKKLLLSLDKRKIIHNYNDNIKTEKYYMCPVYGQISARQPILVDENIEGYLPIDPNTYGETTSDNLFYLKISDESMNLKVKNGDYVLIRKQDYAEDGDIIIAIANDEATLKRYKKLNDQFILLEPMSTDPSIEAITIDLKNNNFKIIGKAIGQFGKF